MTNTIDQTGRPEGHPGRCTCADCAVWAARREHRVAGPTSPPPPPSAQRPVLWAPALQGPVDPATDYLRRIHWWVRLAGIIWIVIPALMVLFGVGFMFFAVFLQRVSAGS